MNVVQIYNARHPRLLLFYPLLALLLAPLLGGLVWRQLLRSGLYSERERIQNQRRVIVPGPRGDILDREGRVLVGNRPRFSVVLNLAELRGEFRREYLKIVRNFRAEAPADRPSSAQMERLARAAVAQRYLDQINFILGRADRVRSADLDRHYAQTLLLPFVLLDDLAPEEYARLIERLPVNSPLQVYTASSRYYPHGAAAAHVLGYVGANNNPKAEDFPGEDLMTFKMKGTVGKAGLEQQFDDLLQGEAGGAIYRVDPAGFKVDLPIEKRLPVQGKNLVTSLDLDLQLAAEEAIKGHVGSAIVLDVRTGEVLVMASAPNYDLNALSPRISTETFRQIEEAGGWLNRAIQGQYPPGSTFKLVSAIAALRAGVVDRDSSHTDCPGWMMVGNRRFPCWKRGGHGERDLIGAIRDSCNIFFYTYGQQLGPDLIANEARRFGFDERTGIELPSEFRTPHVGTPDWKKRIYNERWFPGDTANLAIGQGDTLVTPLHIACLAASLGRGETLTKPTLLHDPRRPAQRSAPLGLDPPDYQAVLDGMAEGYQFGTGRLAKVDGVSAGTKSGTAQKGRIELGWMVALAPIERPEIAIAVCLEGQELDGDFGGGLHAGPVVRAILEKWHAKREQRTSPTITLRAE